MAQQFDSFLSPATDLEVDKVSRVSKEVLGKTYLRLKAEHLELDEDFPEGRAKVKMRLIQSTEDSSLPLNIEGEGVGLVDACFDGLLKHFAREYQSLSTLTMVDFNISVRMKDSQGRRTDAFANATLKIKNSENYTYNFLERTPSVSQSSVAVVQEAIAFFVNSERAFIQLYIALEDAQKRARSDLVERYKHQMSTLVCATSYVQVVGKRGLKLPSGA